MKPLALSSGVLPFIQTVMEMGQSLCPRLKTNGLRAGQRSGSTTRFLFIRVPLVEKVFILHSHMSNLEYLTEPVHYCSEDNVNDRAFIRLTKTISGRDTVEEIMASGMWLLSAGLDLGKIIEAKAPLSKVMVPLPKIGAAKPVDKGGDKFVMRIAAHADILVGRYSWCRRFLAIE
jgi:hypothetical protein